MNTNLLNICILPSSVNQNYQSARKLMSSTALVCSLKVQLAHQQQQTVGAKTNNKHQTYLEKKLRPRLFAEECKDWLTDWLSLLVSLSVDSDYEVAEAMSPSPQLFATNDHQLKICRAIYRCCGEQPTAKVCCCWCCSEKKRERENDCFWCAPVRCVCVSSSAAMPRWLNC